MNMLKTVVSVVLLWLALGATAAELTIHVRPDGNDKADGLSPAKAVASLDRALALSMAARSTEVGAVRVLFAPGTYKAQSATTRGHPDGVPVLITSAPGGRAVFDGDRQGGTWLTLKPRGGGMPSNITIAGLEVTNYETAIDVNGNRNKPEIWAGGMELRDNRFTNIGDIARAGAKPSTAAIRLVNSDHNRIINNVFQHIVNDELCGLLHAIYAAHGSTDNLIEGNLFEDSCGDAVRFRDRSDRNLVKNNRFVDAWSRSPVSDWFCNPKQRDNCTKESGECPSSGLVLEGNKVSYKRAAPADVFVPYGGMPPPECGVPRGAQRATIR